MTEDKFLWFLDLVNRARQGDAAAKDSLLVILETERKPTILRKLRARYVWSQDLRDAHHDVVLRVGEKIKQLRSARAYFKWEARIIGEMSMKARRGYRAMALPLEVVFTEVEGTYQSEEAFDEYPAARR
jgi:hypothetical protein